MVATKLFAEPVPIYARTCQAPEGKKTSFPRTTDGKPAICYPSKSYFVFATHAINSAAARQTNKICAFRETSN
jgi:hypothetical protein